MYLGYQPPLSGLLPGRTTTARTGADISLIGGVVIHAARQKEYHVK